jgi:hypothetical protein
MATTQAAFTAEVRHIYYFCSRSQTKDEHEHDLPFPVLPYCFISSLLQRLFAVSFSGHHQEFHLYDSGDVA